MPPPVGGLDWRPLGLGACTLIALKDASRQALSGGGDATSWAL